MKNKGYHRRCILLPSYAIPFLLSPFPDLGELGTGELVALSARFTIAIVTDNLIILVNLVNMALEASSYTITTLQARRQAGGITLCFIVALRLR